MKKNYLFWVALCVASFLHGQGFESFTNSPLALSYLSGNFVGDNGAIWNYTECRDENDDEFSAGIDGKAILLRITTSPGPGSISVLSGAGGVGEVSMKLYKAFSSTTLRQVDLFVNGVLKGTSTGFNDNLEHIFTITGINTTGDVLIEIKNTKTAQIIVDDVQWSAYEQTLAVTKNQIKGFTMYPNPVSGGKVVITSSNSVGKQVEIYTTIRK